MDTPLCIAHAIRASLAKCRNFFLPFCLSNHVICVGTFALPAWWAVTAPLHPALLHLMRKDYLINQARQDSCRAVKLIASVKRAFKRASRSSAQMLRGVWPMSTSPRISCWLTLWSTGCGYLSWLCSVGRIKEHWAQSILCRQTFGIRMHIESLGHFVWARFQGKL